VNVIVPRRFTPRAVPARLLNLTVTAQLAPGANAAVQELFVTEKLKVVDEPPVAVTATLVTDTCAPPAAAVFVKVTTPVPLVEPVGKVMVKGFGDIDKLACVATPVPLSVTTAGVTVAPV